MFRESDWAVQIRRVEALRQEAAQQHLAAQALRTNIWARLLPLLRRLEGWMERRSAPDTPFQKVPVR